MSVEHKTKKSKLIKKKKLYNNINNIPFMDDKIRIQN